MVLWAVGAARHATTTRLLAKTFPTVRNVWPPERRCISARQPALLPKLTILKLCHATHALHDVGPRTMVWLLSVAVAASLVHHLNAWQWPVIRGNAVSQVCGQSEASELAPIHLHLLSLPCRPSIPSPR